MDSGDVRTQGQATHAVVVTQRARKSSRVGTAVAEGWGDMRDSDAAVELLRDMASRMEQLVSRREFEGMDKRVLALEEWRLAQTQREAERLMQLQSQMSSQQLATQQQVSTNRTDLDGRIMQWFWSAILLVGGILAGHLWR